MNHKVHEGHEEDSVIEAAVGLCRSTGRRKAARVGRNLENKRSPPSDPEPFVFEVSSCARSACHAGRQSNGFVTFVFFVVIRFCSALLRSGESNARASRTSRRYGDLLAWRTGDAGHAVSARARRRSACRRTHVTVRRGGVSAAAECRRSVYHGAVGCGQHSRAGGRRAARPAGRHRRVRAYGRSVDRPCDTAARRCDVRI